MEQYLQFTQRFQYIHFPSKEIRTNGCCAHTFVVKDDQPNKTPDFWERSIH